MPWVSYIAIFFVAWFIVLFVTLPFGVKRVENPEPGQEVGAPEQPYMWHKAGAATVLALIVTTLLWASFRYGWIDFRS
jgi:predicted secreted protein